MAIQFQAPLKHKAIAEEYKKDKRVRLTEVLNPIVASDLTEYIQTKVSYTNAYVDGSDFKTITSEQLKALGTEKQQALTQKIYAQANKGIGFLYAKHQIRNNPLDASLMQDALRWLNSESVLNDIKAITGIGDIRSASAQATRYYPGHFLTRHNDVHESEQRRVAYVLSLTPEWHPDWGGLLQFYESNGTPKDSWAPVFNSLALFDVNHVHSVTYVAPYASKPRLSITGWFRAT